MRATLTLASASVLLSLALGAMPAHAVCKRFGFTVNDYGKEGPIKDAKALLDKHIAKWAADQGIADYQTGKKDVSCELFLNFILFDEHTCTASANVCWNNDGQAAAPAEEANANSATPPTPVRKVAAQEIEGAVPALAAPASDSAASDSTKIAAEAAPDAKAPEASAAAESTPALPVEKAAHEPTDAKAPEASAPAESTPALPVEKAAHEPIHSPGSTAPDVPALSMPVAPAQITEPAKPVEPVKTVEPAKSAETLPASGGPASEGVETGTLAGDAGPAPSHAATPSPDLAMDKEGAVAAAAAAAAAAERAAAAAETAAAAAKEAAAAAIAASAASRGVIVPPLESPEGEKSKSARAGSPDPH